jgi:curved DNA-binding protein CbpA
LVATLYDLLNAAPDATDDDLRRSYYRAARLLHPDLNPGADTTEEMRRLNHAWSILGDADMRRRYDAELRLATAPSVGHVLPTVPAMDDDVADSDQPRRGRLLRPSVVVVAVLAFIFVVTAYAAPSNRPGNSTQSTIPTPSTESSAPPPGQTAAAGDTGGAGLVGKCILKLLGYDAVVVCNQAGAQLVVAEVASASDCPPATTVYELEGRSQLVCLRSN